MKRLDMTRQPFSVLWQELRPSLFSVFLRCLSCSPWLQCCLRLYPAGACATTKGSEGLERAWPGSFSVAPRSPSSPFRSLSVLSSMSSVRRCSHNRVIKTRSQLGGTSPEMSEKRHTERSDNLERVTGIEPALSAWEAEVLPLNYTRAARNPSETLGTRAAAQRTRSMDIGQTRRTGVPVTSAAAAGPRPSPAPRPAPGAPPPGRHPAPTAAAAGTRGAARRGRSTPSPSTPGC